MKTEEKFKPKRYVFEETGEIRAVEKDELYVDVFGTVREWHIHTKSPAKYKILHKVED